MSTRSQLVSFMTNDELRVADFFSGRFQSFTQQQRDDLLSFQRLLRLDMSESLAQAFKELQITSALQIASQSEHDFVFKYQGTCGSDLVARQIHRRAVAVRSKTLHHYLSLKTATTAHYRTGLFSPMVDQAHASAATLPQYDELFGAQDYLSVPDARSVLSPAAYFADLLHLKERFIEDSAGTKLDERRPELKRIALDELNTNTLLPQPALVAYLLENYLNSASPPPHPIDIVDIEQASLWSPPGAVYKDLSKQLFPPQLPFDAAFDASLLLHARLGVSRGRLYSAFKDQPSAWVEARETLNMNDVRWNSLIQPRTGTEFYGTKDHASACSVPAFMAGTALVREQLHEFLNLDYDPSSVQSGKAASSFINQDQSGYYLAVSGDPKNLDQQRLVRRKPDSPDIAVDVNTLDRAARFARLASDLGWSFAELDWALRSSCSGRLDGSALLLLAKIDGWRRNWKVSVIELCALWSELRPSLFNEIFNATSGKLPIDTEWVIEESESSEAIVGLLCLGINVTRDELFYCLNWFNARPASGKWTLKLSHSNIGKLYRLAKMPRRLGFTVFDLPFFLNTSLDSVQDFDGVCKTAAKLATFGLSASDLRALPLRTSTNVKLKAFRDAEIIEAYHAVRTQQPPLDSDDPMRLDQEPDRALALALHTYSDTPPWLGAVVLAAVAASRKMPSATSAFIQDMRNQDAGATITDEARAFFDLVARCITLAAMIEFDEPQAKRIFLGLNLTDFNIDNLLELLDYRLLKRTFKDVDNGFLAFLDTKVTDATALAAVAHTTGWQVDELTLLCSDNTGKLRSGWSRSISGLRRLQEAMDIRTETGMNVVTLRLAVDAIEPGGAVPGVVAALRAKSGAAWQQLREEIDGILISRRRDALVAAAMKKSGARDSRALYDLLLIDTETSGDVKTSVLASAAGGVQLYIQRFLLGLEEKAVCKGGGAGRAQLELEWRWMRSYRLWAANRQVFLFPEDYALPDARKSKSAQFAAFEEALGQTDVGLADVDQAFRGYVDDFSQVASLRTTGTCVYFNDTTATLVLIGVTRKQPYKHFSRFVTFSKDTVTQQFGHPVWAPWIEIDITIKTRDVTPVYAFGRIFLFWLETIQAESTEMTSDEKEAKLMDAKLSHKREIQVSIFTSSHNLNGRWEQPQRIGKIHTVDAQVWAKLDNLPPLHAYAAPQELPSPFPNAANSVVVVWNPTPDKRPGDEGAIASSALTFREDLVVIDLVTLPSPSSRNQYLELANGALRLITTTHGEKLVVPYKRIYTFSHANRKDNDFKDPVSGQPLTILTSIDKDHPPTPAPDHKGAANSAIEIATVQALVFADILTVEEAGVISFWAKLDQSSMVGLSPFRRTRGDSVCDWAMNLTGNELTFYEWTTEPGKELRSYTTNSAKGLFKSGAWQHVVVAYRPGSPFSTFAVYVDGTKSSLECSLPGILKPETARSFVALAGVTISVLRLMSVDLTDDALIAEVSDGQLGATTVFDNVGHSKLITAGHQRDWGVLDTGEEELLVKTTVDGGGQLAAEYWRMNSGVADQLANRLRIGGVDNLLSVLSQGVKEINFSTYSPQKAALARSPQDSIDWGGPNGHYFWELFFHAPRLIAHLLAARQKFPDAKSMLEHIFDPTKDECWRFLGISDKAGSLEDAIQNPTALAAYHDNPFDPHAVATLRPVAYQKAVVMDYVGILIDWADSLFREYTSEAVNEAELLYNLAADLLGRRPANLGTAPLPRTAAYNDLKRVDDFIVLLENTKAALGHAPDLANPTPNDSISNLYFGIPENDAFIVLFDRVDDRLLKIRGGLSIDGTRRSMPLFGPLSDPLDLVRSTGARANTGVTPTLPEVPHYRFLTLLERAKASAVSVCELGSSLLFALEKKDSAQLERLLATHEAEVMDLTLEIKRLQAVGALSAIEELTLAMSNAAMRRDRYAAFLSGGMLAQESSELDALNDTRELTGKAGIAHTVASALRLLPQLGSPMAMVYGGVQTGAAAEAVGNVFNFLSMQRQLDSQMNATQAGFLRRTQEWNLARDAADYDAQQISAQIEGARAYAEAAARDYGLTSRHMAHAAQRDAFLRGRFTSQELYQWTGTRLGVLYREAYQCALALAGQCEAALQFELGADKRYITTPYWDDLRRGLLAGETLRGALNRMESDFLNGNARRLEIQKTFVRRKPDHVADDIWPVTFDAKDFGFDHHYMRQIRSVHVTFPALLGPYQDVRVTLTQTYSQLETSKGELLVSKRVGQQVVLSRGVNDNGMLVAEYDGRYDPFEGTGAISNWELHFLDKNFIEQLSEIVFVFNYTALSK